ncbi:MAG: ATP-NAD kinase [Caldisphaera sp.]|nr:MAG: ATP-NAD kinase [Caldisphaera sp.]
MGLIINPIAGMGGRFGLKGTDGESYRKAKEMGAQPVSSQRAIEFLNNIRVQVKLIVPTGVMGEEVILKSKFKNNYEKIKCTDGNDTTSNDTKNCVKEMLDKVDLLIFVGGDGTARDVYDIIKHDYPSLGIPSGVKMFSAVFANTPKDGAKILEKFCFNETNLELREVLDIDENQYRNNKLTIKLYGYLLVPVVKEIISNSKIEYNYNEEDLEGIVNYVKEIIKKDELYLLGPGSTIYFIAKSLGLEKTLLGVDALLNGSIIAKDLNEKQIIELISKYKSKIIVTPIGGQGFLFGRGNQQFSPDVLRKIGRDNIIVVSSKDKLMSLRYLMVDTGDEELNDMLRGFIRVITGYRQEKVVKLI